MTRPRRNTNRRARRRAGPPVNVRNTNRNHNIPLRPFYIPTVPFAVGADEYPPVDRPQGAPNCLNGNRYYITARCGSFNTFSVAQMKRIIRDYGGVVRTNMAPNCIFITGLDPDQEVLDYIRHNGCTTRTHRQLFDDINNTRNNNNQ